MGGWVERSAGCKQADGLRASGSWGRGVMVWGTGGKLIPGGNVQCWQDSCRQGSHYGHVTHPMHAHRCMHPACDCCCWAWHDAVGRQCIRCQAMAAAMWALPPAGPHL
jgi:hypothetical protein